MFVYSCDKKEMGPTLELINAPVLIEPESTSIIFSDEIADSVLTLKWLPAEYNVLTEIQYTLEVAEAGTNFANPIELVTTYADSASTTIFNINSAMTVDLGLPVGEEGSVEFRVLAFVGTSEKSASNNITISAVTFDPPYTPETMKIMSEGTELKVLNNLDDYDLPGVYEGYVWLDEDHLSVSFVGGDDAAKEIFSESNSEEGPIVTHVLSDEATDLIAVDTAGYYRFHIDMNTKTVDIMGTAWGVIGSAIPPYDWSTSVVMDYIATDDVWTVEVTTEAAEFKFRPNQTWDPLNYGDDGADGVPEEYGANIAVDAGTKVITLDLSEYPYSYTVENATKK